MKKQLVSAVAISIFATFSLAYFGNPVFAQSETDGKAVDAQWATWRGANNNGIVDDQQVVTQWSDKDNVLWFAKIPGRGHSTPIIVNDRIFLTTSDTRAKTQSVLCYDRKEGKELWATAPVMANEFMRCSTTTARTS